MDIGKAFAFVFDDDQWITKILIGAGILLLGLLFSWVLLIPLILAFAILGGYMVEIVRRVIRGELNQLPEWDDWGKLITDGLMVLIIVVVYALPGILVSLCLGIPGGVLTENGEDVGGLFSVAASCLSFLWGIVMSLLLPAAIAFFAAEGELRRAFRFGEIIAFVRNNLATYLVTLVMSWVASIIGSLGSVVCGVGALVTIPYSYMVMGHLYGQAYAVSGGRAAPLAPPIVEEEVL
jgi:predicted outer membrane lipoprotein